jgi:hypothetical protein
MRLTESGIKISGELESEIVNNKIQSLFAEMKVMIERINQENQ